MAATSGFQQTIAVMYEPHTTAEGQITSAASTTCNKILPKVASTTSTVDILSSTSFDTANELQKVASSDSYQHAPSNEQDLVNEKQQTAESVPMHVVPGNERLLASTVEDVGMSFSDETERKLQFSLDELIEQQNKGLTNQQNLRTNRRFVGSQVQHHRPTPLRNGALQSHSSPLTSSVSQPCSSSFEFCRVAIPCSGRSGSGLYNGRGGGGYRTMNNMRVQPYDRLYCFDAMKQRRHLLLQQHHYSPLPVAPPPSIVTAPTSPPCQLINGISFPVSEGAGGYPFTREFLHPSQQLKGATANAIVADTALSEIEILYPPMIPKKDFYSSATEDSINDNSLIPSTTDTLLVKFKGTEVLKVRKTRGDLVLSSGGWRTMSTRIVLNSALKPLGLWIQSIPIDPSTNAEVTGTKNKDSNKLSLSSENNTRWTVTDGVSYLAAFHDDMVIGQIGTQSFCHLLARASVIAQHLKQAKNDATVRRQQWMHHNRQ